MAHSLGCFDNAIKRIEGDTWPTSGAATTTSTGFTTTMIGGTHVGSTDLPPGSKATGYIQGPADTGDIQFRVGAGATEFLVNNEDDNWTSLWLRWVLTGTALAADGTATYLSNFQTGGSIIALRAYVRNLTHNPGYSLSVQETLTGGLTEGLQDFSGVGQGSTFVPFGRWFNLVRRVKRSTSGGMIECYVNGTLIGRQANLPTDGELGASVLQSQRDIWHPTQAGTQLQVTGPIYTYDGPGPDLRPLWDLQDL